MARLSAGQSLGRYELVVPIGRGGMADVWLARLRADHGFERLVALKTALPEFDAEAGFQERFLDEATLAARIRDEHVVPILDLGEHEGRPFMVMEYVDGETVAHLTRLAKDKVEVPIEVCLRVARDAALGLHAAHELCGADGVPLELVHRDVSPQNLIVSSSGTTKVIDFGIAKARERMSRETTANVVRGKVHYMSPEQAMALALDRRTDIWSLGVTLYELISGAVPYDGPSALAILQRITLGGEREALPQDTPACLVKLLDDALCRTREGRISSCGLFAERISAVADELGLSLDEQQVREFIRQHPSKKLQERREKIQVALATRASEATPLEVTFDATSLAREPDGHSKPTLRELTPSENRERRTTALASLADDSSAYEIAREGRWRKGQRLLAFSVLAVLAGVCALVVVRSFTRAPTAMAQAATHAATIHAATTRSEPSERADLPQPPSPAASAATRPPAATGTGTGTGTGAGASASSKLPSSAPPARVRTATPDRKPPPLL